MARILVIVTGATILSIQVPDADPPVPLAPPSGLTAVPNGPGRIDLGWAGGATDATGYAVERSGDGATGWTTLTAALPAGSVAYSDVGLPAGTTYYYRVQTLRSAVKSGYADVASAATLPATIDPSPTPATIDPSPTPATIDPSPTPGGPPPAPTGLTATTYGAARIDLAWTASAGAASYIVERSPAGAGTWAAVAPAGKIVAASWKDPALSGSTAYDYRIKAAGPGGTSAASGTATAATTATGPAKTPPYSYGGAGHVPAAPIQFNAAPFSASEVRTAWTIYPGATYFAVQRSDDAASGWTTLAVVAGDIPLYADSGLPPSTTHYYRVRGGNAYGEVAMYDANAGADGPQTTYAAGAPVLPAYHGLAASAMSPSEVQVRWLQVQAPEGVEASRYLLDRSSDGGTTWSRVADQAATTFTDSGLAAETTYHYRHRAVGAGGTSAASAPVSVTTLTTRSGRSLLQPRDFTYLGSFQPPFYVDPAGPPPAGLDVRSSYAKTGFAIRRVGGELRFLGLTSQARPNPSFLYEFTPPGTLATAPPFPAGTPVKYWGDPYNGKKLAFSGSDVRDAGGSQYLVDVEAVGGEWSSACFMDPTVPNRIWITYANWYNVSGTCSPSFLACDLDDAGRGLTTTGPYRFNERLSPAPYTSRTKAGFGAIPRWFADAHLNVGGAGSTGDAWRMCGFGGNEAGAALASFGPSIVAFNAARLPGRECLPDDVGNAGDGGVTVVAADPARRAPVIASKTLAGYPYNVKWCTRPPGTATFESGYKPDDPGAGYFYTLDRIKGGLFWIDDEAGSRAKHGVFVAACGGFGRYQYKGTNTGTGASNGGPTCDGGQSFGFAIIDPADLAAVAAGTRSPDVPISPAAWWLPDFWNADQRKVPYIGDMGVDTGQSVNGMAFDPATNRLYICIGGGPGGSGHGEPTPIIHVYQVAD